MKSTISLNQSSEKTSLSDRIYDWLENDNNIFSSIMEESVTNRKAVLLTNAMISFVLLALLAVINVTAAVIFVAWFAYSVHLCEKGGIR